MPRSSIQATIGTIYDFITLRGSPQKSAEIVEPLTRPGSDGMAIRRLGRQGQIYDLIGERDFADAATAETFMNGLRDLQGTIVDLWDDHNVTFRNQLMILVQRVELRAIATVVGGKGNAGEAVSPVILVARFTLQPAKG